MQATAATEPIEEPTEKKFDILVNHRDSKNRPIKTTPYRLRKHHGTDLWERPVGSGNLFYGNNEPAGRWDPKKRFMRDEKHIKWELPPTEDQKVASVTVKKDAKIRALELELAAMRMEREQPKVKEGKNESVRSASPNNPA